ncbi:uncharacterized protein AB675_10370 [Cyphellophora attinorum]|uniref:Uncharacterized protein n=1 Tax=Cyphellophora attinorum TaxID=1664694 RepID=A0A0N0NK43_9EURO|nr:uncharacterized protein AB675_10370 [Phialophora attinorum]KPI37389.1 hypothetical protein AB675_10370 [Phialophora attinorum]
MSDEEDTADPTRKASRRDKFKERLARTKTKLSKKDKDAGTTVDDFLATGRTSVSTGRPSVSDSLSLTSDRPPTNQSHYHDAPENQHSTDFIPPPQQSPRRIVVPKIDVSTSQRYPGAQPLQADTEQTESSLLKPHYQTRSQSSSSLSKGRGRARGLSVQFVDRPPVVIGEGGDEAEAPPIEVGKAKVRARSASPFRNNGPPPAGSKMWNKSPLQQIPRPGQWAHTQQPLQLPPNTSSPPESTQRPGIHRVPTGMIGNSPSPMLEGRQAIDREFDMSLGLSPATTISPSTTNASPVEPPVLHAPTPIRPPVAVPNVREAPILHELKSQHGTKSLRNKFDKGEGHVLRQTSSGSGTQASPNSGASEESFAPPPGPPPARRPPPDEEFAPPVGPPPPRSHPTTGYQQPPPPPDPGPGSNYYSGKLPSHPPPPPPPQAPNGMQIVQKPPPPRAAPDGNFAPPPHPPPAPRQAPDDDYVGWVPDSAHPDTHASTAGSDFPGIDGSGKLAPLPHLDEDDDAKPEKSKRRWFKRERRGS